MDRRDIIHALAAMTDDEYQETVAQARGSDLVAETRPPKLPEVDLEARKAAATAALVRRARGHNVAETTKQSADEAKARLDQLFSGKDRHA